MNADPLAISRYTRDPHQANQNLFCRYLSCKGKLSHREKEEKRQITEKQTFGVGRLESHLDFCI